MWRWRTSMLMGLCLYWYLGLVVGFCDKKLWWEVVMSSKGFYLHVCGIRYLGWGEDQFKTNTAESRLFDLLQINVTYLYMNLNVSDLSTRTNRNYERKGFLDSMRNDIDLQYIIANLFICGRTVIYTCRNILN